MGRHIVLRNASLVDVWESTEHGSSTIMQLLAESHARLHSKIPSDEFVRLETWPERNNHVNGEVQLCNYSRDNRALAADIFCDIAISLEPSLISYFAMQRGPDLPLKNLSGVVHTPLCQIHREFSFLREPMRV